METRATKIVNKLVMGRAMLEQLARKMEIAQLASLVFMAARALRNATLLAKVVHSMEAFSIPLGQMIVLHAQMRSLRC